MRKLLSAVAVIALVAAVPAIADSFDEGGLPYKGVTVVDASDGKLIATVGGNQRSYDLKGITTITLDGNKPFNDAEAARADTKKAAELYKRAYTSTSSRGLKRVVAARALPILDKEGRYADAVSMFLELYAHSPTETTWGMKPANMPADASSAFLKDAGNAINAKLAAAPFNKPGDPQRNLRTMLLEIYNRQNDTDNAAKIAKLLGTDIPAPTTDNTSSATVTTGTSRVVDVAPFAGATVGDVEAAIAGKQWDRALAAADTALGHAVKDDVAIRLFQAKAAAYLGQQKQEEAAATYMRIAAHYPTSNAAADALYSAAEIQKKLNRLAEAKVLANEIVTKHKNSPAAVRVKNLGL